MTQTPEVLRLRLYAHVTIDGNDITKHLRGPVILRKTSREITVKAKANSQIDTLMLSLATRNEPFPIVLKTADRTYRIPSLLWEIKYHGDNAVATFAMSDSIERTAAP